MAFRFFVPVAAACAVIALGSAAISAEEIKMFKAPPSIDDLEKALGGGSGQPRGKTRSIQFDTGSTPAAPQGKATPASVSHGTPNGSNNSPAAPKVQIEVSEQAVGFPINFDLGSSNIRPDSTGFIDSIAGLLKKNSVMRLLVEGHTDASGAYMTNLDLSRARAYAVMNYLVTHHSIEPQRLVVTGKGPVEPLDAGNPFSATNRRVQFRVIGG